MRDEAKIWWLFFEPDVASSYFFKRKSVSHLNHEPSFGYRCYPGGPLVSGVGYHPRKKNHVIRVVFQDKAMYARTSFRGAKTCKIGKKGMF